MAPFSFRHKARSDVPTINIQPADDGAPPTALAVRSPGDDGFDELLHPKVAYPTKTAGVPAFRHEEFGWCASPDWRHTSQVRSSPLSLGLAVLSAYLADAQLIFFLLSPAPRSTTHGRPCTTRSRSRRTTSS